MFMLFRLTVALFCGKSAAEGEYGLEPVKARVSALLAKMSVEEKIAQLWNRHYENASAIQRFTNGLGSTFAAPISEAAASVEESVSLMNEVRRFFLNSSLGIPVSVCEEGLHTGAWGGTVFPAPPGLAGSFDVEGVRAVGQAIAEEGRAVGVDTFLSPVVNMFGVRFGRFSEGFSPDPKVTAEFAAAMVEGLQGPGDADLGPYKYLNWTTQGVALSKHYAAYGAARGGVNGGAAMVDNRTLFDHYLRPWRAMAQKSLRAIMTSHQTTLHYPMHGNKWLVNDVLRGAFGFGDGVVLTDQDDIENLLGFGVAANLTQAAAIALRSGIDLDLQGGKISTNASALGYTHLQEALNAGMISEAEIDEAVAHVLTLKFAAGLFDQPLPDPSKAEAVLDSSAHRDLARKIASESVTLVRNENNILPLGSGKKVAVVGPLADCFSSLQDPTPHICPARWAMVGPYALDPGRQNISTVADAIKNASWASDVQVDQGAKVGEGEDLGLDLIPAAVAAANTADVVVAVLGDTWNTCDEEIDRDSLDLQGGQLALLAALLNDTTTPVVVVLLPGTPTTFGPGNSILFGGAGQRAQQQWPLPPVMKRGIDAMVVAWHLGQYGAQAITDVLGGVVNPSGKLAQQWPWSVGQEGSASPFLARRDGSIQGDPWWPNDPDGRKYGGYRGNGAIGTPLFPFGHGLSYTNFTISSPTAILHSTTTGDQPLVNVSVKVSNVGSRAGTEVVQVYSVDPRGVAPFALYWKRLAGWKRVTLNAGESSIVTIPIFFDDLAYELLPTDLSPISPRPSRIIYPGEYYFQAGTDSYDAGNRNTTLTIPLFHT